MVQNHPGIHHSILLQYQSKAGRVTQTNYPKLKNTSPYWKKPDGEVFKASVIKAKAFNDQYKTSSSTITQTYFVDENIFTRYSLPVFSVVTDQDYLFDYEEGLYVKGFIYDEYYSPSIRNLQTLMPIITRQVRNGNDRFISKSLNRMESRHFPKTALCRYTGMPPGYSKKSLRFYARSEYDPKGDV